MKPEPPLKLLFLAAIVPGSIGIAVGWITREQHPGEAATRLIGLAKALTIGGVAAVLGAFAVSLIWSLNRHPLPPHKKQHPDAPEDY